MAGFRTFATGEVLTAANVNDFLMEQATMTFADAASRDTALAGILRAGLNVYLEDTDRLQYYDGTAWENVPNEADVDAAGGLVAVKSVLKTDKFTASVTAGDNVTVTGLSITHEVADPANRLIIIGIFGVAATTGDIGGGIGIAVHDGTSLIAIGDASSSQTQVFAGGIAQSSDATFVSTSPSLTFVHTPGAGSKTYTLRAINAAGGTQTLFVNRNERNNTSFRDDSVGASSLVIQEVKV